MNKKDVKNSFASWCKDNDKQCWLDLWDYELNQLSPEEVSFKSNKKWFFKCSRSLHKSEARALCSITSGASRVYCTQCESFGQWLIDKYGTDAISLYWSKKNQYSPMAISVRSGKKVWIKCTNNSSHPDYETTPDHFVRGRRCAICNNRKTVRGINDIATTHPQFVEFFKDENDAFKYCAGSSKSVWFKCPKCGSEKFISIGSAFQNGRYSCTTCADGVSYGNKFVYCFLDQLSQIRNINFFSEKTFEWSGYKDRQHGRKTYDFYVEGETNLIIEVHGRQHYVGGFDKSVGGRSLAEEIENDRYKKELAINNGFNEQNYIVLDCRISDEVFIKKAIMESDLPRIFCFSEEHIDWNLCSDFATKSLVRCVCELWDSGIKNLKMIGKITGLSSSAISSYLKRGDSMGFIIYESRVKKPVVCINTGQAFSSSDVCSKLSDLVWNMHISRKCINSAANEERRTTHGLCFRYISRQEFRDIQRNEPNRICG